MGSRPRQTRCNSAPSIRKSTTFVRESIRRRERRCTQTRNMARTCMRPIRNLSYYVCLLAAAASLLPLSAASAQNRPRTVAYQFSHAAIMDPTLSPDGKEMIYIMVIAGKEQLMRRAVDGSFVRQLTSDDANHEDPAWSPDG